MTYYTANEKVDFVSLYFQGLSSREISDNFAMFYPDRLISTKSTVLRVVEPFYVCVNSKHRKIVSTHTVPCEENKENISARVEIDPSNSVRSMASELGINRETCRQVLKLKSYTTFKSTNVQKLHDGDNFHRMEFCETWVDRINRNPRFKNQMLFTDECKFYLEGFINKQNNPFCGK